MYILSRRPSSDLLPEMMFRPSTAMTSPTRLAELLRIRRLYRAPLTASMYSRCAGSFPRGATPYPAHALNAVRAALEKWYGAERAKSIQHAEAFEVCEYGRRPNEQDLKRFFPMVK